MIKLRVFLIARSWTIRSCGLLLSHFCVRWRRTVQFLQAIHNEVLFNLCLSDGFCKARSNQYQESSQQYALKSQLYLKGIQATFDELNTIKYGVQLDLDF